MAFRKKAQVALYKPIIWSSQTEADIATSPSISSGSGAPSEAEVNGSLYLRTNGALYQRVGGAWDEIADSIIYNQTLELVRVRAFGSTNTNVLRTAAADQKATGASCFTSTDSATLGRYITASRAIMMTVSVCLNITGGNLVIRAGAALDNSVTPDALEKARGLGLAGASPVAMTSTFHMAQGDICWVAADATPNNPNDFENRVIFSARSV